ncbi:MAG: 6-phospho-beta-glucosidase [Negativicutes bacterium]|nr:6-phospho-beta-glucosidase [Negativicutes bacterium]
MEKKLKIATIGGGSSYTPELIEGFIDRHQRLPVSEIWLVDIEPGREKLEIVGQLARRMVARAGLDINIVTTLDRRAAIDGADFVTTQFRVGGIDARIEDELIPLRYDLIGQETTGAGGFAKALRSIEVIMSVCRDIEELSPGAILVNFANPSGIVTEAVLRHSRVKAVGLCNVPITMVKSIAQVLDVPMSTVKVDFAGLNHLVWARRITLDGRDITAEVIGRVKSGQVPTINNVPVVEWDADLLTGLNMLPCPYHQYFYYPEKMLKKCREAAAGEGCRGQVIKRLENELFELYKDPSLQEKPKQLEKRGGDMYSWAACELICSIHNDSNDIQVVNTLNNGALPELPDDVVIETNCVINRQGARPVAAGQLPLAVRGLLQAVKNYEQLTIDAAVNGDYHTALMALTANPLVGSFEKARLVLDDILKAHRQHLPRFYS